jgi:methyl-accepting chemotaxis protein
MLVVVGLAPTAIAVGAWLMARSIVRRVTRVGMIADLLAKGDLRETLQADSSDELGRMAGAISQVIGYQREMAAYATDIASGDLTGHVQAKSEHDALSTAFATMTTNLRTLVGQVKASADGLAHFYLGAYEHRPVTSFSR